MSKEILLGGVKEVATEGVGKSATKSKMEQDMDP